MEIDFTVLREHMVSEQIEKRGIQDTRLLDVLRSVERHLFVSDHMRQFAYEDRPLPIGAEQTISQPYIVAFMTELLALQGTERVLEIGTGSGYQAAICSRLANEVYTVEIIPELAQKAELVVRALGYDNIHILCADGIEGWAGAAPFDAIIVTCAPAEVPKQLILQLKDNGKMVIPVGIDYQNLQIVHKQKTHIERQTVLPVMFVPMIRKSG